MSIGRPRPELERQAYTSSFDGARGGCPLRGLSGRPGRSSAGERAELVARAHDDLDQGVGVEVLLGRRSDLLQRHRAHPIGLSLDVVRAETEVLDLGEEDRDLGGRIEA